MIRTFLVAANTDVVDPQSLLDLASDFQDDLTSAGHDIESVHPWAGNATPPAPSLTATPAQFPTQGL